MDSSGGVAQASRRLHSSKPPAPPPPQKLNKYDPVDFEKQEHVPPTFTVSNHRGLVKPSLEQTKEPQGLAFRKLDDQTSAIDNGGGSQTKTTENKVSLAHTGETLLATFYGMLYTNDGAEKEWKLEVDGFIPVFFVQVHQNANKPFRIVAVEKTKRIMEYQVTANTTCAKNSTFVKWQDGVSMFGVRFAKEDQAEQFFSTVKRMASTLVRALQLLKQPERKAAISKMTDSASSSNIHHTKVSLMIKLPDKQTTIMSVPGLLTMSELFDMICKKEHLSAAEHQLSLPRMGGRKITFDSGTAVGSLKIREVSIIRTVLSDSMQGSVEDESFEDLLDIEGEENKILYIFLPSGIRKSYRVSLDMTMKQLIMRVCSQEKLNSRHHSLQYIDFKHEFLDMTSTVHELEVNQIRLMDKREKDITSPSSSKREQQQQQRISKFQHGVYNKPIVLIGCGGAGDELNRLAASIITKLSSSGSVLSYKDLEPMLQKKSLNKSNVIVLDFDAPDLNAEEGKNANKLKSHLTDLAKGLYEDEDMLVVYVNVHPAASEMSKMGRECKELLEESVFIKYSDYELCIKDEGLGTEEQRAAWDGIEWQLCRLLARAFLPPATPGLDEPSSNTAHLTMGQNAFFLSLSFPDIKDAEPYVEAMCQDVDAMEFRVDLLACRDDRFELLHSLQKLRDMCRPHALRAPMLPLMGSVIEDSLPVVYTVRTAHQAGTYPDDSKGIAKMFNLLEMGLRTGVEVLDVEQAWDKERQNDLLTKAEDRYSSQILGSHHVVGKQVSTEEAVMLYRQCSLNGRAHGAKVVLSIEDNSLDHQAEEASKIAHSLAKRNDDRIIPHVGLILGKVGQCSRVLNLAFTPVTHESLPFVVAPGQMTASELMATRITMGLVPPKKYAILGHNIAHSISPAMHSAAFAATKLPHSFSLIDTESVEEFVSSDFWNNETFGGTSVAIPHKQSIIPHLDVLTDAARSIGAVNTVIVKEKKEPCDGTTKRMLVGDNTDWKGIFNPLSRKLGVLKVSPDVTKSNDEASLEGGNEKVGVALILVGDDTAPAAAYAASQLGLERIYYNRLPPKATGLANRFGGTVVTFLDDNENAGGRPDSLGSILDAMNGEVHVVISTLPAVAEFRIPSWLVKRGKESKNKPIVFDINYKPYWTKLLYQAEGEGFDIVRGSEMLWEQGVRQFELWTERTAPYKVMKNVVLNNCLPQEDNKEFIKSSESDSLPVITGEHQENNMNWQRSKSLDVLSNDNDAEVFSEQDKHVANRDLPKHSAINGTVPITVRRNSSGGITNKKPPMPPLPYAQTSSKSSPPKMSREVPNGSLKNQSFSPIKKGGIISASTPDLSVCSSKSDDSPESSSIKTSTPDAKSKRRAAPPPPQRPPAPKALFVGGKPDAPANGSELPVKTPIPVPRTNPTPVPRTNDAKLKPGQKKRPAPPRPVRPPPPQPARQSSTESRDSRSSEDDPGKKQEVNAQFRQNGDITNLDHAALPLDLKPPYYDYHEEEEDRDDDLRGVPIFIPPPPPDELPPPLDECATPVGPLTDFEADILEGSAQDNFPVTVNGFVGIGKYLAPSVTGTTEDERMQTESTNMQQPILWSKQETALETVPEHASIPVVPPPPMYSETPEISSSEILLHTEPAVVSNKKESAFSFQDHPNEASCPSVADIPPPLLETESTSTSQDTEEKDRDSGLDQSPTNLDISPPAGLSENAPVQSWEEPDSGSSLDAISAIPPPTDFATIRPLTPPCQFANPTVAPPDGFVEEVHEQAMPRKKLNISEALFPWMNEPQAPVNATIPLAVSAHNKGASEVKEVDGDQKFYIDKKVPNKEASVVVPITTISVKDDFKSQSAGKPEVKTKHDIVLEEQEVKANVAVSEAPRMKLPRALSSDEKGKSVVPQKVEIPEAVEVKTGEAVVLNINSVKTEHSGLQHVPDTVSKRVQPENEGVQQPALPSFYPSTEVARLESQVKPPKPDTQVKPVTVVKEAEVQIEAESPSPVHISRNIARPELLVKPVKLKPQVKPEKQETQIEPATVVKAEAHTPSLNNISRDNVKPELEVKAVKKEPPVELEKIETKTCASTLVKETRVNATTEQPVKPEKPEVKPKPVTVVKEAENKVEPKVDVPLSFNSSAEVSGVEPQFENAKPVLQVEPENLQSRPVEEVMTPQSKSKVERSIKTLEKEQEVKSGINKPVQESAITIVNVGKDDVVEAPVVETPVTPETKSAAFSYDKIKDLEQRLLELDKEPVPSSTYSRTSQSNFAPTASQKLKVERKDPFAEEVIMAETKRVEFSSYEQFEELLKLDNEVKPMNEAASVQNKDKKGDAVVEKQHPQRESSSPPIDVDTDLRLDLSSLRQSPEPPRPPSSSPPAPSVAHWSSVLPSPRELLSDRSTESGISINEERKRPNAVDPNGDEECKAVQVNSTQAEVPCNISAVSKPHTTEKPPKLQRPLSMPEGVFRDFKSGIIQEKNKSATESDSRKSSLSDSTGVSSSSLPSSPSEVDNTESVDLPKPPPFTVPPLRRYSDLAADLSFISSAAKKATEKSHEDETKPSAPPKPVNLALKRSSFSVVERPRSWMGPETNNNKRSVIVPSAFKPASFEAQGKKAARPVDFNIKPFNAPSTVSTAPSVNSTSFHHSEASSSEKEQAKSSPKELEKPPKHTPVVTIKPRENSVNASAAPVVSPMGKKESAPFNHPTSTGAKSHPQVKKTESRETKYEIVFSNNSSETRGASKGHHDKTGSGSRLPSKDLSSSASIREQIMRDASGGNKITRPRPQSAIVGGSKFQILTADDRSSSGTGVSWADVKKLAAQRTSGVKSGGASWVKRQASEPSKPDTPHNADKPSHSGSAVDMKPKPLMGADSKPQPVNTPGNKPQLVKAADVKMQPVKTPDFTPQPVKTTDIRPHPAKTADIRPQPAVNSRPLPNVVMRTKTGQHDPTKRHSMPTYIIEAADRKPTPKTNSRAGQFHFNVVNDVNADTTVVPQGVVAAMKALREKKGNSQGD